MKRGFLDSIIVFVILLFDQVTKIAACLWLEGGRSHPVASFYGINVQWTLTTNSGAAWGAFSAYPHILFAIRLLFIALLFFLYARQALSLLSRIALLAILAGAIGNLIDTSCRGHVVDMIHVIFWGWDYPVFNVADSCIFLGCFFFFCHSFVKRR